MVLNILRELTEEAIPEFVKTASVEELDPEQLSSLPDHAFADPKTRQYPVHTKAAAFVSAYRYLHDSVFEGKGDDKITQELMKFASVWGIEPEVKAVTEKLAAEIEPYVNDIPDDKFILVYTDDAGVTHRQFLALDAETTKKAAVQFFHQRHLYPLDQRRELSAKFNEKLATFNPVMSGRDDAMFAKAYLDAMKASPGCPGYDASAAIDIRRHLIGNHETCKELEKTAKAVRSRDHLTPEETSKLASLLDAMDMEQGLYVMYGKRGLKLPEDDLYAHFGTVAEQAHTRVKLASGSEFDRSDFEKVGSAPFDVLPETLDVVYVDGTFDVDAAVKVASELPASDARLFGRAMAEALAAGVQGNPYRSPDRTAEEDSVPLVGLRA